MRERLGTDILEHGLDRVGALVDDIFLTVPRLVRPFQTIQVPEQDAFIEEIDFYFKHGYVDWPETFFQLPETVPEYEIYSESFYDEGIRQVILFPSDYEPRNPAVVDRFMSYIENRSAYMIRWTHGEPGRKTIVCLHGYMLGNPNQAERMFKVRSLFHQGLDVALFITPFHWRRAPRNKSKSGLFLQPADVSMTTECFGQAMHDLYHCFNILRDQGAGEIGIIGASLGGYNAGLMASLTDKISFAALMVPAVKFGGIFGPGAVKYPFEMDHVLMQKVQRVWTMHSPLNFTPKISKNRILIIAARGDRLCPFHYVRALCEKWGWPKHVFLTGGHWMVFNGHERGRAWYRFLTERGFIPKS